MPQPRRSLVLSAALVSAAVAGWLSASSLASKSAETGNEIAADQQVTELLNRMHSGELSGRDHRWLLERLLSLGRLEEARRVLSPLLVDQPHQIRLSLLMADLLRQTGAPETALHELDQLLSIHPNHPGVMQMRVLVDLQQGRSSEATVWLQQKFQALPAGKRTLVGLLMADLQIQQGRQEQAEVLYRQLAAETTGDARPVLALAMLRGEQGRTNDMQVLLHEARRRRGLEGVEDPLIDAVGARWGLQASRQRPPHPTSKL